MEKGISGGSVSSLQCRLNVCSAPGEGGRQKDTWAAKGTSVISVGGQWREASMTYVIDEHRLATGKEKEKNCS